MGVGKTPGRLDYDLRPHRFPGQLGGILLGENLDGLGIDRNAVGARGNLMRKVAKDRVVLEQVGQRFGIGEIVDSYELEIRIMKRRPQHVAADTPEAVDTDFNGHVSSVKL